MEAAQSLPTVGHKQSKRNLFHTITPTRRILYSKKSLFIAPLQDCLENQSLHRLWFHKGSYCSPFPLIDVSDHVRRTHNIYLHTHSWILHLKFWEAEEKPRKLHSSWLKGSLPLYYCKAKSKNLWLEYPTLSHSFLHGINSTSAFITVVGIRQMVTLICLSCATLPIATLLTEVRWHRYNSRTNRKSTSLRSYSLCTNATNAQFHKLIRRLKCQMWSKVIPQVSSRLSTSPTS